MLLDDGDDRAADRRRIGELSDYRSHDWSVGLDMSLLHVFRPLYAASHALVPASRMKHSLVRRSFHLKGQRN